MDSEGSEGRKTGGLPVVSGGVSGSGNGGGEGGFLRIPGERKWWMWRWVHRCDDGKVLPFISAKVQGWKKGLKAVSEVVK